MCVGVLKVVSLVTIIASLFGCGKKDPHILDGPGMVYIDSEYRSVYANCLPFEDISGAPYLAIAYLGNGDEGEKNKDVYINKIFESLNEEEINQIKTYEYEGNDWFLVIPKYRSVVDFKRGDVTICRAAACIGEAFVVKCSQDIVVSTFESTLVEYKLSVDKNRNLANTDENVWDITNIDEILIQ